MSRPAVVLRAHEAKMAVRIPYRLHKYPELVLHDLTGHGTARPIWDEDRAAWLLPRRHAEIVILGLAQRFREVSVFQYGDPAVLCRRSCQSAQSSVTACECSCAGAGHGLERRPNSEEAASARTGTILGARVGVAAAFVVPGYRVEETAYPARTEHGILRRYTVRRVQTPGAQGAHAWVSPSLGDVRAPSAEGFADVAARRIEDANRRVQRAGLR